MQSRKEKQHEKEGIICYFPTVGVLNNVSHTSNNLNDLRHLAGKAYTGEAQCHQLE